MAERLHQHRVCALLYQNLFVRLSKTVAIACIVILCISFHLFPFHQMCISLSASQEHHISKCNSVVHRHRHQMGNSLSAMISRIRTFYVGAQEGKDSISMVDKVTDVQLLQFHEAFSFFDKVCA